MIVHLNQSKVLFLLYDTFLTVVLKYISYVLNGIE